MTIVQIGTNNGADDCNTFVRQNKDTIDKVYLIEPLAKCNTHIIDMYNGIPNVSIHNIGISDNPLQDEITMFHPAHDETSAHSASNIEHLIGHDHRDIHSIVVPCMTLDKFFETNNITQCDRLYIDTEGLDCKILLGFDFVKYDIKYIEFEILHTDGVFTRGELYDKCISKFKASGYRITAGGQYNECAIKI